MTPSGSAAELVLLTSGQWGFIATLIVLGLALKALVVWWIWTDARWRGVDPLPWTVAAVLFDLIALAVWTFARPTVGAMGPKGRAVGEADDPRRYGIPVQPGETAPRPDPEDLRQEHRQKAAPHAVTRGPEAEETDEPDDTGEPPGGTRRIRCPGCGTETTVPLGPEDHARVICPSCGRHGRI